MTPEFTSEQLAHLSCQGGGRNPPPYRVLPDGTAVWVYMMTYGKGRLCIGHEDNPYSYDRGFCYETVQAAFKAADEWTGQGDPEGWFKNLQTKRYRPNGDPALEHD